MRSIVRSGTLIALVLCLAQPLAAQDREGLMGDLIRDVTQVESKIVGLAKAMPDGAYEWRPGDGVRSTAEVFKHVAADNYFLPAVTGSSAPAGTGITSKDFKTAVAFEKRPMQRDEIVAELEKSFAFLKKSMAETTDTELAAPVDVFGRKMSHQRLWIMTTTHLHEHLGQLIAYARSNKVTPPWSK